MAIPFISIELDKVYNLRFGMGAQIQYEQLSGQTIPELGKEMQEGLSIKSLGQVLFVMLKREIKDLTLEKTSDLVDEYADNMAYVTGLVCEAIEAAYKTNLPNEETPEANRNG